MYLTEKDKLRRDSDAMLVDEYYKKSLRYRTEVNRTTYLNLQNWFYEKYNCYWKLYAKEELRR